MKSDSDDDLHGASDLRATDFSGRSFNGQDLHGRDFRRAILRSASFVECNLEEANFAEADLSGVNFRNANCRDVDFSRADLTKANFYGATLTGARFVGSNLYFTIFRNATMGQTVFAALDLETSVGLDEVKHEGPSSFGFDCLQRLGNNLPMKFLSGIGLDQVCLAYIPELARAGTAIQFNSCFISYSHLDEAFARTLWAALRNEGIRVWYAPENMKGGRKLYDQIDRAIQLHDKLLLVISPQSIGSEWVKTEIDRARKHERKTGERKLFPIRLCRFEVLRDWECFDADSGIDVAKEIREYFIPDFSEWTQPAKFQSEFSKLRADLQREGVPMRRVR